MKRFINMTFHATIDEAIKIAESLLSYNSKMLLEISKKNDFKYDSGNGVEVALSLHTERAPVSVFTYKTFNPWSSVIGYSDAKSIFINVRKLPSMGVVDVASNLLHEYSHHAGFSHGSNYKTQDKELYSVPYYLSENILKWL
jgi:hypothetical protein